MQSLNTFELLPADKFLSTDISLIKRKNKDKIKELQKSANSVREKKILKGI
jgi:hypothetical protein